MAILILVVHQTPEQINSLGAKVLNIALVDDQYASFSDAGFC